MQIRTLAGIGATAFVLACAAERRPPSAEADAAPAPPSAADSAMTPPSDPALAFTIQAPPSARAGQAVPFTLRLTNTGAAPRDVYLLGRAIAFDVVVSRADGTDVWRRLEGEAVQSILQIRTLAPGESLEFEHRWDGRTNAGEPVAPGDYRVRGILPTDARPFVTPEQPLRVVAR